MQKSIAFFALVAALPTAVFGQSQVWGQCGGIGWTGPTTCVSGSSCVKQNDYYSQCLPGASVPTTTTPPPTTTTTTTPPTSSSTSPTTSAPTTTATTGPVTNPNSVHQKFKAHGKLYFGTCSDSNRFNNAQGANITVTDFGQVTPENSMKWDATEPNRGSYNFGGSDALVNFATTNGLMLRGHTFLWAQQIPGWINNIKDAATMTTVIQDHIRTVMTRYKGKVYGWDIVNEHINEDGSIKSTPFTQVLGNDAFRIAFQAARAADPDAKLYINDYNLDSNNAKVQGIVRLVQQLNANGTKLVDGIGSQAHITGGQGSTAQAALTALAAAGVEVAITELDIAQAPSADYTAVVRACLNVPACVGITVWGVRDPDSWRASTNPLLFDANFQPKPAYNAILAML
ncbi:hypothetical protein EXIGLDRAFT_719843 [Exidia glandulosa HHB12029]|uniref:Beta-xylanase n=1 Tax=Exidia glandulosa HHB12029 TaxID=1314781 RepID=A0A165GRI7_EXIGL|nr:hypothetical protein EXIGLDRAFT_719843 [Exidia glandulosa HHB12029]